MLRAVSKCSVASVQRVNFKSMNHSRFLGSEIATAGKTSGIPAAAPAAPLKEKPRFTYINEAIN